MAGEKPREQPERAKTKRAELAFLHNHAYFVIGILEMRGLFSVALVSINYLVSFFNCFFTDSHI
ncbi:MAG: hypothetical protein Q8L02_04170 [Candidatus Nitrotoga sp.]|nr:hypothetical protein [Candidatus Nitrotoga sp.]